MNSLLEESRALIPLGRGVWNLPSIRDAHTAAEHASFVTESDIAIDSLCINLRHVPEVSTLAQDYDTPVAILDDESAEELARLHMARIIFTPRNLQTHLEISHWHIVRRLDHASAVEVAIDTFFMLGGLAVVSGTNNGIKIASDFCDSLRRPYGLFP